MQLASILKRGACCNKSLATIALLIVNLGLMSAVSAQSAARDNVIRLSDPVAADQYSETFGAEINMDQAKLSLSQLSEQASSYLGKPILVETRIAKVCQKKGCFFIAQQNQHTMRVSFRDYGFFIPTNSSGKQVLLAGELVQKEMSKEQAEHFNSDIKDVSNTLKEGVVYEIIADGIRIPRT